MTNFREGERKLSVVKLLSRNSLGTKEENEIPQLGCPLSQSDSNRVLSE